jgi:hypothetical protein
MAVAAMAAAAMAEEEMAAAVAMAVAVKVVAAVKAVETVLFRPSGASLEADLVQVLVGRKSEQGHGS